MTKRRVEKSGITHGQFHSLIKKAAQPIEKPTESDAGQSQTSAEGHSDGCNETHTHSDKTGDI